MEYILGQKFTAEIPKSDPLPALDYLIPSESQNYYDLHRLFTGSFETETRIQRRRVDEDDL